MDVGREGRWGEGAGGPRRPADRCARRRSGELRRAIAGGQGTSANERTDLVAIEGGDSRNSFEDARRRARLVAVRQGSINRGARQSDHQSVGRTNRKTS